MATKKKKHEVIGYGQPTNPTQQNNYSQFVHPFTVAPVSPITPAPPAPATPPAPAALPPDASYEQILGSLGKTRDSSIADITGQRTRTLADYGYTGQFDENGNLQGQLSVDPNNSFSRAAALKRNYDQNKTGNVNSYAARGQLHAGSLVNAQNANDYSYQQGQDTLQKNLGSLLASYVTGIAGARQNYELGAAQAYGDRLGRAAQNPLYSPQADNPAAPAAPAANPDVTYGPQGNVTGVNPAKWVTTTYTNSNGHKVKVFMDGHEEVLVGGQWKRV